MNTERIRSWNDSETDIFYLRSNPQFEHSTTTLLRQFHKVPDASAKTSLIIEVRRFSEHPEVPLYKVSPGTAFDSYAQPYGSKIVISRSVNSSFIGIDLDEVLRRHEIQRL